MEEKQKPRRWSMWLVVGLALLVAYPLSIGPMYFLANNGYLPQWVGKLRIYRPLHFLGEQIQPIAEWTYWYCSLWVDEALL